MIKCKHCGCFYDATIPARNLAGIDVADLIVVHDLIERCLEDLPVEAGATIRSRLETSLKFIEQSGQIRTGREL